MSNHTPVAPAANENQLNENPVYQSLANYAKDGLYLLEELDEISGVLRLLTETCHERYEDELGNALTLINKSQNSLYQQLKEKLQTLSQKTKGLQTQGAHGAP